MQHKAEWNSFLSMAIRWYLLFQQNLLHHGGNQPKGWRWKFLLKSLRSLLTTDSWWKWNKKRIITSPNKASVSLVSLEHCACPEETAKHPRRNPPSLLCDGCQILGCCCPCGCLEIYISKAKHKQTSETTVQASKQEQPCVLAHRLKADVGLGN